MSDRSSPTDGYSADVEGGATLFQYVPHQGSGSWNGSQSSVSSDRRACNKNDVLFAFLYFVWQLGCVIALATFLVRANGTQHYCGPYYLLVIFAVTVTVVFGILLPFIFLCCMGDLSKIRWTFVFRVLYVFYLFAIICAVARKEACYDTWNHDGTFVPIYLVTGSEAIFVIIVLCRNHCEEAAA